MKTDTAKALKIIIGADHAGYSVKEELFEWLTTIGYRVVDVGTTSEESCDYPDFAFRVGHAVASGRCDRGILACGTGIGMAMAANKVKGIRAGVCWSVPVARLASEHNWCNVLCLPSRFVPFKTIKKIVTAWLETSPSKGGRHERRIRKILKIESK